MANFGERFSAIDLSALDAKTEPTANVKATFHPLMGHIYVSDAYTPKDMPKIIERDTQDYVLRELGLGKEIVKNNRVLKGLSEPGTYLMKKNEDLVIVGNKCSDTYRSVFTTYSNKGYSLEEAKRYAMEAARDRKKALMDVHDIEFPTDVSKSAISRLSARNDIGGLGTMGI